MKRPELRSDVPSLTLLRVFLVASAAILVLAGFVLAGVLTTSLRHQVLADREVSLTQFVGAIVRPDLVKGDRILVGPKATSVMETTIAHDPDIVTVKIWRDDGVLAWTNRATRRIGKRFEIDEDLGAALHGNTVGMIGPAAPGESSVERALGFPRLLQIYAPILAPNTGRVVGAYEIYADPRSAESFIAYRKRVIWLIVAAVFAALYLALAAFVRGASGTLQRRTAALRERTRALAASYDALDRGSLEAIAALNAIVEAKDPYTAGHSVRVLRIAELIGAELRLTPEAMEALRQGAQFHDIGKVRVPDAILTKPGVLTAEEHAALTRHAVDGADIVGHLSSLRGAVPVIRHHHERWDGLGYPDRLAGGAIPLGAAITGLADAWDAMTTDRPYHRALATDDALEEVRAGRERQFHPAVVDAFFRVVGTKPDLLLPRDTLLAGLPEPAVA